MARAKDAAGGRGSSTGKKSAVAKEEATNSPGATVARTRRKASEAPKPSVAPASDGAVKKQTARGSRVKAGGPKKTVKRVSAQAPASATPRAAGSVKKKGAAGKAGGTQQASGDVPVKEGKLSNKRAKVPLKEGKPSNKRAKAEAAASATEAKSGALHNESSVGEPRKKRKRKKEAAPAVAPADKSEEVEEPNKRTKTSAEAPKSPSRRPGLRNSDAAQEENAGRKRKGSESQGPGGQAKKRKGGKKEAVPTEESTKADDASGNGTGPRRSSRNVKAGSHVSPSNDIQEAEKSNTESEKEEGGQLSETPPQSEEGTGEEPSEAAEEGGGSEAKVAEDEATSEETKQGGVPDANNESDKATSREEKEDETTTTTEKRDDSPTKIHINRAPVITLWVPVVAERQGFKFEEGLSFGKAIAGMYAHAKGKRIGVIDDAGDTREKRETRQRIKEDLEQVEVFGTKLSTKRTPEGHVLAVDPSGKPIAPAPVLAYLKRAFGSNFGAVKGAMEALAQAYSKEDIGRMGYNLYEKFRPAVPEGGRGWGAKGLLDLSHLAQLTQDVTT